MLLHDHSRFAHAIIAKYLKCRRSDGLPKLYYSSVLFEIEAWALLVHVVKMDPSVKPIPVESIHESIPNVRPAPALAKQGVVL